MNELNKLKEMLVKFREDRNWGQFHTPENLAKSVVLEASELLENFQWGNSEDINNISEEIADVFGYLLLMCEHYDLDIIEISKEKIKHNEEKYPIDKAYGVSTKYNKL